MIQNDPRGTSFRIDFPRARRPYPEMQLTAPPHPAAGAIFIFTPRP